MWEHEREIIDNIGSGGLSSRRKIVKHSAIVRLRRHVHSGALGSCPVGLEMRFGLYRNGTTSIGQRLTLVLRRRLSTLALLDLLLLLFANAGLMGERFRREERQHRQVAMALQRIQRL